MNEQNWTFFDRLRVLGSLCFVGLPVVGFVAGIFEGHLEVIPILIFYLVYIVAVGALLCLLAQRLFLMHGVRKLRMGMFEMMTITSLLVLPLGFARVFVAFIDMRGDDGSTEVAQGLTAGIAVLLYMLIPCVFFFIAYTIGREEGSTEEG